VRARAATILGRLCLLRAVEHEDGAVQVVHDWIGCPVLLGCARALLFDEETELPHPNRFSHLDGYLLRLNVIEALATCREEAREQPGGAAATGEVFRILQLLLKYNDNSQNGAYSDGDYVAALLLALARACSSDLNEVDKTNQLIARYCQRELLMPSYAHRVTCAALGALQQLQYRRLVPLDLDLFLRHAKIGQSTQVRCAALSCLAAMTPVQPALILPLLRLLALEQVARVRHSLLNAMLAGPAALLRSRKQLDVPSPYNIQVVNALWSYMNEGSAFDVRSRFLAASLYSLMLGEGHPECMLTDGVYAAKLRPLPSESELDTLRFDPKRQSLKVTILRGGNDTRKGKGMGSRLEGASARSRGLAMRTEARAGLGAGLPKPPFLSAEDKEMKLQKQQEERKRRMRERERTLDAQVLFFFWLAVGVAVCDWGCVRGAVLRCAEELQLNVWLAFHVFRSLACLISSLVGCVFCCVLCHVVGLLPLT